MLTGCACFAAIVAPYFIQGTIDPRGVYFHRATGSFSATEWATIFAVEGENKYEFDDIADGLPFDATILPEGNWVFDDEGGTGSFTDPDNAAFSIFVTGLSFQSEIRRVPYTTPDFPVLFHDSVEGDEHLSGSWMGTLSTLDPLTGEALSVASEQVQISVTGDVLRMTRSSGTFYTGPFEEPDHIAIRALRFNSPDPDYKAFPGSTTNETRNVLGELRVLSDESIQGVLLLQTNTRVQNQTQTLIRVELSREYLADINDDGNVSAADFTAWVAAFNAQGARCDQNADGLCTPSDFTAWVANFNAGCD